MLPFCEDITYMTYLNYKTTDGSLVVTRGQMSDVVLAALTYILRHV